MEGAISIREAEPGDNEALLALQLRCPQGTDLVFQFDRSPDFFARSMPYERCWTFVAEEGGQIVGSIECALREAYVGGVLCKAMYAFGVMVDPKHRRKGIASMLQAEVDRVATHMDADLMYVFIVEENVPSIRLAEKMGYLSWKNVRENLLVAYKEEEVIKAVLGYWEYYKVLAPRVVKYNLRMRAQMLMLRVMGLFSKVPKMPGLGERSLQCILTPVAYRDLEGCQKILKHVNNLAIENGVHFVTLVCEVGSPLEELMEGYRHTTVTVHQMVKPLKGQVYDSPSSRRLYMNVEDV